jgi:flagellin
VQNTAAQFGAVQQNIESQQTFIKTLSDNLTTGVGNLVDADMTAASARLSALQTQQSLGTQALSIANQAPQALLKLFG